MLTAKFLLALAGLSNAASLFAAPANAPIPGAPALFCCTVNGRSVCADAFPEACRGKPYKTLDSRGNVLKELGPPKSADQRAVDEAEEKQKKDQKRHDQALLDTYSNAGEIEIARERAESLHNTAIINAEAQIAVLKKRRKALEAEAGTEAGKKSAAQIQRELQTNEQEIRRQEEVRDGRKKELEGIRAKYEADRKRYLELTGGNSR